MRTTVLGLDAFDPVLFERLYEQGRMPNLGKYVESVRYNRLQVSNPSQSEVSWTSIASGANPGQHGLFDFVHRNPATYSIYVSMLPTVERPGGTQFVRPSRIKTMFDQVAGRGYPATTLWWPATFPARPQSPVRSLPGLGTPDIQGRLGIGVLYTTDPDRASQEGKTPLVVLKSMGSGRFAQELAGPVRKTGVEKDELSIPFQVEILDEKIARLKIQDNILELKQGRWSPILELNFKTGLFFSIGAVTRVILTHVHPHLQVYFLPLQLHPLKPLWRYGTPGRFVKEVWKNCGPFLTLGWPQDTTALEEGILTDEQFLALCASIFDRRAEIFLHLLGRFQEGLLGTVFDTLDRVQHMFWRDHPEIVEKWYHKFDTLVGKVEERLSANSTPDDRLVIVSDHGFADFDYKVHLNRWLIRYGYLFPQEAAPQGEWGNIDWTHTRAYAIGLNSIYLNLAGREAQGQVEPGQRESFLAELRDELLTLEGPDGNPVVQKAWINEEAFSGSLAKNGPDLIVGYAPGYRASPQTGLGGWELETIEPNRDHWQGDHCINPQSVPGVVFSSQGLQDFPNPSYYDIPELAINETLDTDDQPLPPDVGGDEEIIRERLKSLGYL